MVDCFLLVEMPENEMWFVSDNIVNRTHLLTLERTPQLVAQLTQMFEILGYSVSVRICKFDDLPSLFILVWYSKQLKNEI